MTFADPSNDQSIEIIPTAAFGAESPAFGAESLQCVKLLGAYADT